MLGVACSSEVDEGGGTLPPGIEDDLVPDVEYDLYLYFNPDAPVAVDYRRFLGADQEEILALGGNEEVSLTSVSMVATSLDQFGGILGFATSSDAELAVSLLERSSGFLPSATSGDAGLVGSPPRQNPVEDPPAATPAASTTVRTVSGDPTWAEESLTVVRTASTTIRIIRGDAPWIEELTRQFESQSTSSPPVMGDGDEPQTQLAEPKLVSLKERSPQAWNMLTNLPVSEDEPPVAAGFISTDGNLIQEIAKDAGIEVPGLDTAFGIVRVDNVAFGIYSDLPESIPEEIDVELLDSLDTGVVLVGGTGYAGVAVAFLVRSIAGKVGMDTISLGNTNARHLEIEDGHLVLRNKGSLIYATVAGTRNRAEELMLRALAE